MFTLLLISNFSFAAGITGTKHDFKAKTWPQVQGEICIVCHVPHNGKGAAVGSPLWNHTTTVKTYTLYTSTTGKMKAALGQPDGVTKMCLSCHDGTIAVDSFNGFVGTTKMSTTKFATILGSSHGLAHPLSFVYDKALSVADTRLFDPTTKLTALGGTIQKDLLINGKMQCSSCHDVHNKAGLSKLFKIAESTLCKTCHNVM